MAFIFLKGCDYRSTICGNCKKVLELFLSNPKGRKILGCVIGAILLLPFL